MQIMSYGSGIHHGAFKNAAGSVKSLFANKTLNCFKRSSLQKHSHPLLPSVNHEELVSRLNDINMSLA